MKQICRQIQTQLSPDNRTVDELFDKINGRETAVVKTSGLKWAALLPLTAALGIALLAGVMSLSSNNDIKAEEVSETTASVEETPIAVDQTIKEFGYPAAQVETPVEVADGKFDFKNGGYYGTMKHQPKDPPDEETKKRLLMQNKDITIYNKTIAYRDDATMGITIDLEHSTTNVYHADDESFETSYHVSRISHYVCMGKVKDGDRIYELLVGYTGFGMDTVAVSFGDGKYYLYRIPNFDLELEYASLHLALGEEQWGLNGELAYNSLGDTSAFADFTDSLYDKIIEYLEANENSVSIQNDGKAIEIRDGEFIPKGDENFSYKFGGVVDRSEFDDSDVRSGFGDLGYSAMGGSVYNCYEVAINSPAYDGSILVLFPNQKVIKLVPKDS